MYILIIKIRVSYGYVKNINLLLKQNNLPVNLSSRLNIDQMVLLRTTK